MAIAKDQIQVILDIVRRYIERDHLALMLADLKGTTAYSLNKSFAETINRIEDANKRNR